MIVFQQWSKMRVRYGARSEGNARREAPALVQQPPPPPVHALPLPVQRPAPRPAPQRPVQQAVPRPVPPQVPAPLQEQCGGVHAAGAPGGCAQEQGQGRQGQQEQEQELEPLALEGMDDGDLRFVFKRKVLV